jgi:hypothetical protein
MHNLKMWQSYPP